MAPTREQRRRLGLGAIASIVAAVFLSTGTTIPVQRRLLEPEHWSGGWQERVPVSGGIRVGVVVWQAGRFNPRELALQLPERALRVDGGNPLNRLCVEISSRDGRYSALLDYDIQKEPAGPVKAVVVKAPDLDKLNAAAGEDVSILASLSQNCRTASSALYLVAAWSPPKSRDAITVLLNSRVPTTIVGPNYSVQCRELSGITTAFNLRCDLPAMPADGKVLLGILQKRGRGEKTVPLPLIVTR